MTTSKKNRNDAFWKKVAENRETVKTWPKWMQSISISAYSANTGDFTRKNNSQNKGGTKI